MSSRLPDLSGSRRGLMSKGRFEPTEPLHMTTRHAARNVQTNGTPSLNGSADDNESRRGSLEGTRPTTSQSLGSQTSATGRRISGESNDSDNQQLSETRLSAEKSALRGNRKLPSSPHDQASMQMSPTRSLKRKRVTPTPSPPSFAHDLASNLSRIPEATEEDLDALKDVVIPVPEDYLSDRESGRSSADEHDMGDYPAATQSTETTPAATPSGSVPVSPVSDETNPTPTLPSKQVDVIMTDINPSVELEDAAIEESTRLADLDEVDEMAEIEDDDEHVASGKPKKATGKRRTEHPSTDIEALHRRQLQLKSAYRAISRALKPVLAEIASKTVENLEANPALHEQAVEYHGTEEYEGVQDRLDRELAERKAQLEQQFSQTRSLLQNTFEGQRALLMSRAKNNVEDSRQAQIDQLHHQFLSMIRQAAIVGRQEEMDTEDEDDVIPLPKGMDYRYRRQGTLDAKYHSRSRLALELDQGAENMHRRFEMRKMLEDFGELDVTEEAEPFAFMDSTTRDAGTARQESKEGATVLVNAALEVERRASIPVIANKDAHGLQLLGQLATRPSIRALPTSPYKPRRLGEPFVPVSPPPAPRPSQPSQPSQPPQQWKPHRLGEPFVPVSPPPQMPPPSTAPVSPPAPPPQQWKAHRLGEPFVPVSPPPPPQMPPPSTVRPTFGPDQRPPPLLQMSPGTEQFVQRSLPFSPPRHSRQSSGTEPSRFDASLLSPASSRGATLPPMQPPPTEMSNHTRPGSSSSQHSRNPSRESMDRVFGISARSEHSMPGAHVDSEAAGEKHQQSAPKTPDARTQQSPGRAIHEFSRSGPLSIERLVPRQEELHQATPKADIRAADEAETIRSSREASPRAREPAQQKSPPAQANALPTQDISSQESIDDTIMETEGAPEPVNSPMPESEPAPEEAALDMPSEEGAADIGDKDEALVPEELPHDTTQEAPAKKARSRASSQGQSTATDEVGSQEGDSLQRRRGTIGGQDHKKSNKAQRQGMSRKAHRESKSFNKIPPGSESGSQMFRFRLNSTTATEPPKPAQQWPPQMGAYPGQDGHPPFHPFPAYGHPHPPFGPPGPYPYYYDPYGYPPPAAYWPPPPFYPGYGVPYGPPMGPPPPGDWSGSPPAGPPSMPQRHSQPSPGSFTSKYGGPAIAPATPDARNKSGTPGANHGPAFAQQQRNSESGRKRTQSDQPKGTKFHHYEPKDKDKGKDKDKDKDKDRGEEDKDKDKDK